MGIYCRDKKLIAKNKRQKVIKSPLSLGVEEQTEGEKQAVDLFI